jgi:hypothetical protein
MSEMRRMNAYLVHAPGLDYEFHKRKSAVL